MIDSFVSVLHKYGRYPLGLDIHFQFDSGRSYNRLKQACYYIARVENARIKALDAVASWIARFPLLFKRPTHDNLISFVYPSIRQTQTLHTVRLLLLHAGRPGQPLVGTLTSFTMFTVYLWTWSFDMPHYEALSYCWGAGSATESISLNGRLLNVTKTVHSALQQLRLPRRDRYLWIDQVCIDQGKVQKGDFSEKNYQVRRMGEIYANAQRTVVWLGEDDSLSRLLFSALDRIDDSAAANRSMYFWAEMQPGQPVYNAVNEELCQAVNSVQLPQELRQMIPDSIESCASQRVLAWALFEYVLKNPWFERMWILQEGALAHDLVIQSGGIAVPWRRFVGAIRIMSLPAGQLLPSKGRQLVEVLEVLRHTWYTLDGLKIDLARMLEFSRPREATDSRDKIYGLVGMYTPWSVLRMPAGSESAVELGSYECIAYSDFYRGHRSFGPQLPAVDYKKSVEQVFIDTALALFSSGKLDILKDCCAYEIIPPPGTQVNSSLHGCYFSKNPESKHALPSWAYDWSISAEGPCRSPLVDDLRTKEQPFHACKDMQADVKVIYEKHDAPDSSTSLQNTTIALTGILVDEIEEVVEHMHTHENSSKMISRDIWADWTRVALADADEGPYGSRPGSEEAFWRTLICDKPDGLDTYRAHAHLGVPFVKALYETIVSGNLPAGFEARSTSSGHVYYVDHDTKTTSWSHPRESSITHEEFLTRSAPLRQWLDRYGNKHMKRRLFRTRRGYVGMSCPHVQKGDYVAVLWGGRLPFILRPRTLFRLLELDGTSLPFQNLQEDDNDATCAYELIGGECYIHGLVDGEVLDIAENEDLQSTMIYLQ